MLDVFCSILEGVRSDVACWMLFGSALIPVLGDASRIDCNDAQVAVKWIRKTTLVRWLMVMVVADIHQLVS